MADPALSENANRELTAELRAVVGAKQVRVPVDRPRPSRGQRATPAGVGTWLAGNRLPLAASFSGALLIGAILALTSGSWLFLPLAVGVHWLGTALVTIFVVRLTKQTERPGPQTVALLAEEGVGNPEAYFSEVVDEFRHPDAPAGGETEARTVEAHEDPATAASEQRGAMTPSASPSKPVGP